jgi:uncharacterized protein with FMN-binding domain
MGKSATVKIAVALVATGLAAAAVGWWLFGDDSSRSESVETASPAYRDGTYTATGNFISQAGPEEITATFTLVDGVVVDSAVIADSMSRASQRYQQRFADSYATQVVGRPLAEIETVVVAGATASSLGFQDALAQIKDEARR